MHFERVNSFISKIIGDCHYFTFIYPFTLILSAKNILVDVLSIFSNKSVSCVPFSNTVSVRRLFFKEVVSKSFLSVSAVFFMYLMSMKRFYVKSR